MNRPAEGSLNPEQRLVLELCRTPLRDEARSRANKLLGVRLDWGAVLDVAERWDVEPAALTNLLSIAGDELPETVRQEVTQRCWAARARSWKLTAILLDLLRLLEGDGIRVIVLKGPAVALAAYGEVTMRSFGDLDLLVQPANAARARELLAARGFRPYYEPREEPWLLKAQHALELSDGLTHVELHTALLSRYLNLDLDLDAVWRDAYTIPCLESTIRVLPPRQLYVYLCAHGAKHRWELFRWACDVAQLDATLEPTDVDGILALAGVTGARRLVALGARLAGVISGGAPTRVVPDALAREEETRALVSQVATRWFHAPKQRERDALSVLHPSLPGLGFWISTREHVRDRLMAPVRLVLSSSPRDAGAGSLRGVWRPLRLAAGVVRRTMLRGRQGHE